MKRLFIVTGEHSGDMNASFIVKELKSIAPEIEIEAVGGNCLLKEGVKLFRTHEKMGKMGFSLDVIIDHFKLGADIAKYLKNEFKPDAVLLVDYGGFNLRLAAELKKYNIPVFYFISPQVWASRKGRINKIRKFVSKMMLILPFEEDIHLSYGVNAQYVGHPLVTQLPQKTDKAEFLAKNELDPSKKIVGICPGSRKMEIDNLMGIFLDSAVKLSQKHDDVQFCLAQAPNISDDLLNKYLKKYSDKIDIKVLKNQNHDVLAYSDVLILASGTITLEAALYNTPMIVSYKGPILFYFIFLLISYVKNVSLPNIILGERAVEEFIQFRAKPDLICAEIEGLLYNESKRKTIINSLKKVKEKLGDKVATVEVSKILKDFLIEGKM